MRLTSRGSGCFFANFFWTAGQNDSNHTPLERYRRDATFSCRTLSLIPYGLRAVSNLPKYRHSVFSRHQNRRGTEERIDSDKIPHYIRWASALHGFFLFRRIFSRTRKEEHTASGEIPHFIRWASALHGFFVGRKFSQTMWSALHVERWWTAILWKVNLETTVNRPWHYRK